MNLFLALLLVSIIPSFLFGQDSSAVEKRTKCDFELNVGPNIDTIQGVYILSQHTFKNLTKRQANKVRKKMHLHRGLKIETNKAFYNNLFSELCSYGNVKLKRVHLVLDDLSEVKDFAKLILEFE